MTFEDQFAILPEWQQSRFRLMQMNISVELNEADKDFLVWLAGQDMYRIDEFLDLAGRANK